MNNAYGKMILRKRHKFLLLDMTLDRMLYSKSIHVRLSCFSPHIGYDFLAQRAESQSEDYGHFNGAWRSSSKPVRYISYAFYSITLASALQVSPLNYKTVVLIKPTLRFAVYLAIHQ
jgi:hypothetical protein